jgi:DnaJ family protein C protein 28
MADEDDSNHIVILHKAGSIVTRPGASVKVEEPKGARNWESWLDQQIREAQERGEFDNLPGKGQPLDLTPNPYAGDRELAFKVLKDAGYAPEWIELDKAIRARLEKARAVLARRWQWHQDRLAELAGQSNRWAAAEQDRSLAGWREAIAAFEQEIAAINKEISELNLKVPSPRFQRATVNATREVMLLAKPAGPVQTDRET